MASVLPDGLALRCVREVQESLERIFTLPLVVERKQPTLYVPLPLVEPVLAKMPPALTDLVRAERPDWLGWRDVEATRQERRKARQVRLAEISGADDPHYDLELLAMAQSQDERLDPFQHVGVAWMRLAAGLGILGDETVRRPLIVCPTSVAINWSREAEIWAPSIPLLVAPSKAKVRKQLEVLAGMEGRAGLVVSWGMLRLVQDELLAAGFDSVVCDEAHNMKEPTSQRSRAVVTLAYHCEHRLALTGTSVRNRPRELWMLLHFVDPLRFPLFVPFGERYCGARNKRIAGGRTVRSYDGKSRQQELNTLTRAYLIRREKRQVLTQLPPKRWQTLKLVAPPRFMRAMKKVLADLQDETGALDDRSKALGMLQGMRKDIGLAKVEAAVEQIETMLADDEPVVLFLYHSEVRKRIEEELDKRKIAYGTIVGGVSMKRRQQIVDDFQSGKLDVLIGSEACKEGITLTRSRITLHVEYWWTPGDQAQAEDRVARRGQTRATLHVYLHLEGSLDDHVARILTAKQATIDRLMDRSSIELAVLRAVLGSRP
jgi:SNF2 family DNA or RNA helicase